MDATGIGQLIGSLGFPVAMCIIMFLFLQKTEEKHSEEIKQITEALHQNTIALTELKDILNFLKGDKDAPVD